MSSGGGAGEDRDREVLFERLVADHQDRALRLALRFVSGDRAAAEDIVQEAFIRAHRGLSKFRGDAKLSTWFDRILIREAYRHHRRPWRRWLQGESPELHLEQAPGAEGDPWLRSRVESALKALSTNQRLVFVLVHVEGHTVSEVADLMQRSPGTVKSHLHRALTALRKELGALAGSHARTKEEGGRR